MKCMNNVDLFNLGLVFFLVFGMCLYEVSSNKHAIVCLSSLLIKVSLILIINIQINRIELELAVAVAPLSKLIEYLRTKYSLKTRNKHGSTKKRNVVGRTERDDISSSDSLRKKRQDC